MVATRISDAHAEAAGRGVQALLDLTLERRRIESKCEVLLKLVFDGLVYRKAMYDDALLDRCRTSVRELIFKPYLLQKTIDEATAGGLNYGAINELRKLEDRRHLRCCLPSSTMIQKCARRLEQHAMTIIPWTSELTDYGPVFEFRFEHMFRYLMEAYGLTRYCLTTCNERQVLISFTLDGAVITKYLSHLLAGMKMVDSRALDPTSNLPLFLNRKYQSRELCFPFKILFAKDSKKAYHDVMKNFFAFFNGLRLHGLPASDLGPAFRPFAVPSPQDLSSQWKAMCEGGGSGNTTHFCPSCAVTSTTRGTPAQEKYRCARCVRLGIDLCYDHTVCDKEALAQLKADMMATVTEDIGVHYEKFDKIKLNSRLLVSDFVGDASSSKHLKFDTTGKDEDVIAAYNQFLMQELLLRYPTRAFQYGMLTLEERRECLKTEALIEHQVSMVRAMLGRKEAVAEVALIVVEQAMPCLLHCENRVNEKVFHTLIQTGILRYGDADGKKRAEYVKALTEVMQTKVLGTVANPYTQWNLRFEKGKKTIEQENLTNPRSRLYIRGLKEVIATVFHPSLYPDDAPCTRYFNEMKKDEWLEFYDIYAHLMVSARKEDDFSDAEIEDFHTQCGVFMTAWVKMAGKDKVTNYIHMIGSGHLVYYLKVYRNLYKYSNQGWEALNQKLKRVYFNNTNHGGSSGGRGGVKKGHVEPLWLYFARSTLWKTGEGDNFFTQGAMVQETT